MLFLFITLVILLLFLFCKFENVSTKPTNTPNCLQANKRSQPLSNRSDRSNRFLTAMDSKNFTFDLSTIETARQCVSDLDPECRKILVDALDQEGVLKKKATSPPRKSPSKKLSLEDKNKQAFNPNLCHARILKQATYENGNTLYRNPNKQTHLACIDFQCCGEIFNGDLCKSCYTADTKKCTEKACADKGKIPFGTFDQPLNDDELTRVSKNNGKKHTYIMQNSPKLAEYSQYKQEPGEPVSKKDSNSSTESENQPNIDWKQAAQTNSWKGINVNMMKAELKRLGLDTKGKKEILIEKIKDEYLSYDDQDLTQEPQQPESEPENEPETLNEAAANALESNQVVNEEHDNHADLEEDLNFSDDERENDDDDGESEEEDPPEEVEIQGVTYILTDEAIVYKKGNDYTKIHDDPNEKNPENWSQNSQKQHNKLRKKLKK